MEEQKVGLYAGIILIVIAAILLLGNFMGDNSFPAVLGFLGMSILLYTIRSSNH